MLVKLSMKNFKSFVDKTEIDLNATGYEILSNENKTSDNILKGAIFVGGNATGKTNVIRAIRFLLELLVWQADVQLFEYKSFYSDLKERMELIYEFKIKESYIKYAIETDNSTILKEELTQDGKQILVRINSNGEYTNKEGKKMQIDNVQKNQSALRAVYFENRFIDNDVLQEWFDFLKDSVYIDQANKFVLCANQDKLTRNYFENNGKEEFNEFLKLINYNQTVDYVSGYKNKLMQFNFQNRKEVIILRKDMDIGLPMTLESLGNQTLVEVLPQILQAIKKNCMVIIDEFSSAFHNQLEEKIIKYFMEKSEKSQMFIVSHSTNLLTNTLLRPDQIYTVDYIIGKGSKLYRVSDSKPREAQNLEKMYLSGVFNGLPNIK
ncbi:MAG: AAA family ATPase [Clostridia bacterium]|nr:AAA family ATPase [Clostridia bacterium]